MKRIIVSMLAALLVFTGESYASPLDHIETDKVAHAAVSYVISDQLYKHGMNHFWAATTTIALGAAKEKFLDSHWDGKDFAADCMGAMLYQIRF